MKFRLKFVLFFFFASFGGWLLLEICSAIVLRFFVEPLSYVPYTESTPIMDFSPSTLWEMSENDSYENEGVIYKTNSEGLREMPRLIGNNGTILAVGDSSTFGFGVSAEDSYLAQLGQCGEVQTLNGGVPGYSSEQSLIQLKDLLKRHRADWVVIASLWSDMMYAEMSDQEWIGESQRLVLQNRLVGSFLYKYSATFQLISAAWMMKSPVRQIPIDKILVEAGEGGLRRVSPERYSENLRSMISTVKATGAIPLILLLPTNRGGPHPDPDTQRPYRSYADMIAAETGVEIIDMDIVYKPLPSESTKGRFLDIVHPNELGHADIASELCELIRID